MTTQEIAMQVRQLSHTAKDGGQAREAEVLELIAQGFDSNHSDIIVHLLRSVREAYLAGQRDCAKHSGCFRG